MTAAHSPAPEELMAYLDGELSAEVSRDLRAHLATCEACQRLAGELRQVSGDIRTWTVEEPPATLRPAEGTDRTRLAFSPRHWTAWRFANARVFAFSTAAVGLVVLAIMVSSPQRKSPAASAISVERAPSVPSVAARRLESSAGDGGSAAAAREQAKTEQRAAGPLIVRTTTLRIVAPDFDNVRPAIDRALRDMGGFVGQLGASDSGEAPRSIQATLRVPAARLDEAVAALKKLGRVIHESQQADDVTEQVVDLDVRIANARITEKRLNDLIQNRTGRVSDVLEAEREMARVRTELERLDAQRKNVEGRVAYATLVLEVLEERGPSVNLGVVPVPARLRHAVADGFEAALSSVLQVALFLLRAGPSIVLWGVLLGVPAWMIVRRRLQTRH